MKKKLKFVIVLVVGFLSGCANMQQLAVPLVIGALTGHFVLPPTRTGGSVAYDTSSIQQIIPPLIDFNQKSYGSEWSGIFVPKNLDLNKSGTFPVLVVLNSDRATYQDFEVRRGEILKMFPSGRIVHEEDIMNTQYRPRQMQGSVFGIDTKIIVGSLYTVFLSPSSTTSIMLPTVTPAPTHYRHK